MTKGEDKEKGVKEERRREKMESHSVEGVEELGERGMLRRKQNQAEEEMGRA